MKIIARSGVALLAALALLALVALLVGGGVAATTLARRSVTLTQTDARLTAAADDALGSVLAAPAAYALADLPLGIAHTVAVAASDPHLTVAVQVTRLPAGLLWLVADVSTNDAVRGHRRVNLVARFPLAGAAPPAPLVARGDVVARSNVSLFADTSGEADCATPSAPGAMVGMSSSAALPDSALVLHSNVADDSATYLVGSALWSGTAPPGVTHVQGDTTLGGGVVDGLLLVDGTLIIAGAVTGTGLIVARGPIRVTTGSLTFTGALLSYAPTAAGAPAVDLANASIRYAPCAALQTLRHASPPRPVRQRSWAELF